MSLEKAYQPGDYETDIYSLWESRGVFKADPDSGKKPFTISMPPPNETGTLSLGHALFLTLQDVMARHHRQLGEDVLWLPGTDHAALAVNAIIEKKLAEEGTDKHEIGREAFLQKTREFVGSSRETMLVQMRAMGASADWSRLRYTLDDALNRCVNETFVKMYEDGLIYRGARVVNWDPNLQTTISDDEVEYVDETTVFYAFKYGPFEMGTTRPETKFGTQYVVMHPDDERYRDYKHGDSFETEWINGPVTVTIVKDSVMDMSLGTGIMSITPWHSHIDFDIAERHGLKKEQIIDEEGELLPITGEFEGMDIAEARPKIVEKLRSKGLVASENSNYQHNVATNERGKGIIEPQIRLQWWVDVNRPVVEWKGIKRSLKEILQSVVNDGDINIIPNRFNKIYFHWIDNLRDWCISRQIWWGHRIPVWYHDTCLLLDDEDKSMYFKPSVLGRLEKDENGLVWCRNCKNGYDSFDHFSQDQDTLDTWFSSSLWTWSTLVDSDLAKDYNLSLNELLEKSQDYKTYHPTSVMETGWDILFFWVARMVLSTTYVTGEVPFKDVYLHGMVRAEDGKKMSKSRPESIIDPLQIIPQFGTDALRMALVMGVSPGNDQNWGRGKVEANRNFANKLWNIARYIEGTLGEKLDLTEKPKPETVADHWVIAKLDNGSREVQEHLAFYRFSEAYSLLYHLIWDDVADWYIEASKTAVNSSVLNHVLATILKLLHPFAPFVTETIWQQLSNDDSLLATQPWPSKANYDTVKAKDFVAIQSIVTQLRQIKTSLQISGGVLAHSNEPLIDENKNLIMRLAKLGAVGNREEQSGLAITGVPADCWFVADAETAQKYMANLNAEKSDLETQIKRLQERLANKNYVEKAPAELIEETRQALESVQASLEKITTQINSL